MNEEAQQSIAEENQENDFLDFIVGASVMGGFLFGIFIIATILRFFL